MSWSPRKRRCAARARASDAAAATRRSRSAATPVRRRRERLQQVERRSAMVRRWRRRSAQPRAQPQGGALAAEPWSASRWPVSLTLAQASMPSLPRPLALPQAFSWRPASPETALTIQALPSTDSRPGALRIRPRRTGRWPARKAGAPPRSRWRDSAGEGGDARVAGESTCDPLANRPRGFAFEPRFIARRRLIKDEYGDRGAIAPASWRQCERKRTAKPLNG